MYFTGILDKSAFQTNKFYFHVQKITTPPIFGRSSCNLNQMKAQYLKNNVCKYSEPKL